MIDAPPIIDGYCCFWKELVTISGLVLEIDSMDHLIDVCYELSNSGTEHIQFR